LISNAKAGRIDLNVFSIKYSSMSSSLVERGALSVSDKASWYMDEWHEKSLRDRVLGYCSKKDWRLSANDTGKEPSSDELKEYVLAKARAERMKDVYEKERAARGAAGLPMRGLMMGELTMKGGTTSEIERLTSIRGASSAPVEAES
jgi:hypothetical protein